SNGSDFNRDFQAAVTPDELASGVAYYNYKVQPNGASDMVGISVFAKDEAGEVFHTYSCYSRGVEMVNGAYHYLDLVPKGRSESGLAYDQAWVRRHDQY
ncbi:MAG: DUF899 family protein, partial [Devosia nanyangense]|nr:DUF899 family protein [Devosia nanyangense]